MAEGHKDVWSVYRTLLHRFMDACRKHDDPRKEALFALLQSYQKEFPEECEAYEREFG